MKIAHVHSGGRGIASYLLNMYNYFSEGPIETLIVSEQKWRKKKIPVFEPRSIFVGGVLPWAINPQEVEDKLAEFNPDIYHHHNPCGRLDFYAERTRRRLDSPLVTTYHISIGSKKYFVDWVMHTFYMMSRRNFLNGTTHVAISQFVRKQLEEIAGVPKERIVTLYAGVNPEVYKPIPFERHDTLELLFVGQIMAEKGIDGLVETVIELSKHRKVRLSIIGEGHFKSILEMRTKGNPAINWVGFLPDPKAVAEYYAKSDAVIFPTRWEEAFSYIPIESMSAGTAIIASRTGGNTEAVQEGVTGHLFEPGDFHELFELLKDVEIEKLWEMGARGREYALKHHTLSLFGQKYESLYANVLKNPEHLEQID